mgnify:CR=1 FL=1
MIKIDRLRKKLNSSCGCSGCRKCELKISRIKKYINAGIPAEYWNYSFKNFSGNKILKQKITEYLKDIGEMYDEGKSVLMVGTMGTGKTYSACCMLKIAIMNDFSGMYVNMVDIINNIISNNQINSGEYIQRLLDIDFLVIDELDSRWIFPSEKTEQIFGSYMEYILRSRFQNHMPTIMCSNTQNIGDIFSGDFSKSFKSLTGHYVDTIVVAGKDFRKRSKV